LRAPVCCAAIGTAITVVSLVTGGVQTCAPLDEYFSVTTSVAALAAPPVTAFPTLSTAKATGATMASSALAHSSALVGPNFTNTALIAN
jgi:hypothetical protein